MSDPNFEHTVVLLWNFDEHGAVGVVVNRGTRHKLSDVLDPELRLGGREDDTAWWGGPVDPGTGTVVVEGPIAEHEGDQLTPNLSVTRSAEALERLLVEDNPMLLCFGYAGWGPGQLNDEIESGGWLFADIDLDLLFRTPVDDRYAAALASIGLTESNIWMQPIHE